ncbi:MAG: fasciclin domain-containing protein, partial [Rhodobacterales bacterium]|nr:fasciclin domain-containing protein [Rhodobacterales bacterium]
VNGASVHVNGTNGVRVNNANVTQADIIASNGVIHRIDTVLIPR